MHLLYRSDMLWLYYVHLFKILLWVKYVDITSCCL